MGKEFFFLKTFETQFFYLHTESEKLSNLSATRNYIPTLQIPNPNQFVTGKMKQGP